MRLLRQLRIKRFREGRAAMIFQKFLLLSGKTYWVGVNASRERIGGSTIQWRAEFYGDRSVVPNLFEDADDGCPVKAPHSGGHPVIIGNVKAVQAVGTSAKCAGPVSFLQIHVENIEANPAVGAGGFGQCVSLIRPIDEIGLEAVDGLNPE